MDEIAAKPCGEIEVTPPGRRERGEVGLFRVGRGDNAALSGESRSLESGDFEVEIQDSR